MAAICQSLRNFPAILRQHFLFVELKRNIFRRTIDPASLIVIAVIVTKK